MLKLNIGNRELKVKFGYEPTLKCRIISKVVKFEEATQKGQNIESVEDMLLFLPEFLLVGLQVYQKDEYGFEYGDLESEQEQIDKMFALIETYCESENEDENAISLFQVLSEEMLTDSFLGGLFRKEKAKAERKPSLKVAKKEN